VPTTTAEALRNVISTGRDSLTEMRRLLDLVRRDPTDDPELAPTLGVGVLAELVDRVRAAGTPVALAIDGTLVPLPAGVDLFVYRIVQEALTNVIKHAGASASASLRVSFEEDGLVVEVSDDGVGGEVSPDTEGAGLRGIAERVAMLGGELEYGPGASGGFHVLVRLPLAPVSAPA
jgi:signal transduction histidine kinase